MEALTGPVEKRCNGHRGKTYASIEWGKKNSHIVIWLMFNKMMLLLQIIFCSSNTSKKKMLI